MNKVTKYSPRYARYLDRFPFDNGLSTVLDELMGWNQGGTMRAWAPNVDIVETDEAYRIHAELPGVTENEVTVTLNNNTLTLSGEKKQEVRDEQDKFVRVERTYGSFERSFSLPSNIVADKVDAAYQDGVLTITVPKAEAAKSRAIKISR